MRHDIVMSEKITKVNEEIGQVCTKLNALFIDNSTIDHSCLNDSKLHLNAKGSAILAVHLIKFLKGGKASTSTSPKKQRYEDFQRSETWRTVEDDCPTRREHSPQKETLIDLTYGPASGIYDDSLHAVTKLKGFKIASLNINSLLKHIDELRVLISNSTIDILAINESKIDDSVFENEINILIGYNMIRNDRNRFGGGVVLYIRDTISFF